MKKDITEIIEDHIEKTVKNRTADALSELFLVADNKPGVVVAYSMDDRFGKWHKPIKLADCIDGLIADCGSSDGSNKVLLKWGQWMVKKGQNMINQAELKP